MRLHAFFCVVQLVLVTAGFAYYLWFTHFLKNFDLYFELYSWGNILESLSYALLYGYIGYLMITLSAPEDQGKSQKVAMMLSGRSSFTREDDLYQAEGIETIKAIIGQFLTN
jgi:hypothetical protein